MTEPENPTTNAELAAEVQRLSALLTEASRSIERIAALCAESDGDPEGASRGAPRKATTARGTVVKRSVSKSSGSSEAPQAEPPRASASSVAGGPPPAPALRVEDRARALSAEVSNAERSAASSPLTRSQQTARVAMWAGRARSLLGELDTADWRTRELVERVLTALAGLSKNQDLDSVEALDRRWNADDWRVYCEYQRSVVEGSQSSLTADEQGALWRSLLLALRLPGRKMSGAQVADVVVRATNVLGADDPLVLDARQRFGDRIERALQPPPPSATTSARASKTARQEQAVDPLTLTSGLRALLLGGEYEKPSQQNEVQQLFKFSGLRWMTAKSGSRDTFERTAAAITDRSYDVVFALPGADGEELRCVLEACTDVGIPIVPMATNYSKEALTAAALEHLLPPS
ncbi:MAG TPA: hypothetical protein VGP93_16100 [Polyangiaceae bacterium]|jgi:hypothetical protein|nr:hypothetical protein [Polyangiaceae bacterium]